MINPLHGTVGLREGLGLQLEPGHFQGLWVRPVSISLSDGKCRHIILNEHSCLGLNYFTIINGTW